MLEFFHLEMKYQRYGTMILSKRIRRSGIDRLTWYGTG
jgi:hypothetical protein